MIYQFYYKAEQETRLFNQDKQLYVPFGLTVDVNKNIANLPFAVNEELDKHLVEFSGMLYLWLFPPNDGDSWIGFTSYRQPEKSGVIFKNKNTIETYLEKFDFIGWLKIKHPTLTLHKYAESVHPGISAYMYTTFKKLNRKLPKQYFRINEAFYANYWIMSKQNFNKFMQWIYPFMINGIEQIQSKSNKYLLHDPRALGYVLERMFIAWYLTFDKNYLDLTSLYEIS